jgi:hypothetical protein
MTVKVFSIDTLPGVQRDGTVFDMNFYVDAEWVRFQRGRPRKIGGYRSLTNLATGYSRGIYVNSTNGFNQIFNGTSGALEVLTIDNTGIGAGVNQFTLSDFTSSVLNLWQFDSLFDATGSGNQLLLAHPGQNLAQVDAIANTPVLQGNISGTTLSKVGVFSIAGCTKSTGSSHFDLPAADTRVGIGQLVTGNGIQPNTFVTGLPTATRVDISNSVTNNATATITFDNQISVSGGVVVLHPYVFIYGNNGLIKNCAAGDVTDWVSADSNETNAASTKIVKGLPVRGGSNSPSGLFWALDSLIRVSYAPSTVGATTLYWRYDVISSQSSILSSSSVIEYDGVYYWCGVDRFLLYNGVVKEIKNNYNQNYFFDNLNYAQRQKVWATKVPRFGEIWWFFPSGDSVECNDCVIYNVREEVWYDAGQALGANRSAGYFSQVFSFPINAGTNLSTTVTLFTADIVTQSTAVILVPLPTLLNPNTNLIALGQLVTAAGVPANSVINAIAPSATAGYWDVTLSNSAIASAPVVGTFSTIPGKVTLWQHEIGTDEVNGPTSNAINSFFETSDLGWVQGGPAQPSPIGDNNWVRVERVEPDFVQSGTMSVQVTGRPYAQADDVISDPYYFEPDTHKIDMREQRREIRLRFSSNEQGGNYQLGRVLLSVDIGDVRGY